MPRQPGRLSDARCQGRRAVRRQGAQPEEAGHRLHAAGAAADERLRRMVNETVAMEIDHHPHRGRSASAGSQPDQAAEAALQHRAAGRQVLPVADADRGPSVPADRQASRRAYAQGQLLGAVRLRLGGEPDRHRDAARVPAALLRRHGVRQPHAALPAVPDPPLLGALRRAASSEADYGRLVGQAKAFLAGKSATRAAGAGRRDGARRRGAGVRACRGGARPHPRADLRAGQRRGEPGQPDRTPT